MRPIVTDGVARSVALSVCHDHKPCKNGWTHRHAVSVGDSGWCKEPCIRWGSRSAQSKRQFWGIGRGGLL